VHPAVIVQGPRQCGKTTLAKMIGGKDATYFDLERALDQRKLSTPELTLSPLKGLVVIDEAQRMPELFPQLRVLLDRPDVPANFLLTGSASPDLIKGSSESLAGRVGIVDLAGFDLRETGVDTVQRLWVRGGFPRSYLAANDLASHDWRESFVRTFLEKDIPQLGIMIPAATLRRFWSMIAHYHGQVWNAAEFARSLGVDEKTARRYLDILSGAFMVRILTPWFENLKKRQVKSPKIYIRDSGLLHTLLGLGTLEDLLGHPKVGASWEGFVIEQILASLELHDGYFWSTHNGAELDLFLTIRGKRHGFEVKFSEAPAASKSMQIAIKDLKLEHLWVIYPGSDTYQLDERITAVPASQIMLLANKLKVGDAKFCIQGLLY
jgi:uncharacterized protein